MPWIAVARKEALEILRSPKFTWTFGLCALLVLLAFYVGGRSFLLEQERWEAARAENLRQLEGETDWLEIAPTLSLPPQPITALVGGIAHDIGRHATVEGRGPIRTWGSRYGTDPVFAVFRFLDLEFIFRVILSLFALLFAYDSVCGEKERGTLRLCFSHEISRSSFLFGKLAGTLSALVLPFLVPVGLGALLWRVMEIPMASTDWIRISLLLGAGFLYVSCFLALAAWVSTLTQRSSHAFLLLLSVWVVLVLVVPRAAVSLAARQAPVLSTDEIQAETSRLRLQLWRADHEAIQMEMRTTLQAPSIEGDSMESRVEEFTQFVDELGAERERKLRDRERSLEEKRRAQQKKQQTLAFGLARISPAAALSLTSANIAGTSLELERHFRDELRSYQQALGRLQSEKSGGRRGGGGVQIRIQAAEEDETQPVPIDPSELPTLAYEPPALARGLRSALPDLALLVGFNFFFFAASFASFLRYDLR